MYWSRRAWSVLYIVVGLGRGTMDRWHRHKDHKTVAWIIISLAGLRCVREKKMTKEGSLFSRHLAKISLFLRTIKSLMRFHNLFIFLIGGCLESVVPVRGPVTNYLCDGSAKSAIGWHFCRTIFFLPGPCRRWSNRIRPVFVSAWNERIATGPK